MTDTAPPAAPSADVTAQLDAARSNGGLGYLKAADDLVAAGHAIPYQHRKSVESIRAAVARTHPGGPSTEHQLRGGLSADSARAVATADAMGRAGIDRERIREAVGVPDWVPEDRSAEQVRHDQAHGIQRVLDPRGYVYTVPPGGLGDPGFERSGTMAQFDIDARCLSVELHMPRDVGGGFIRELAVSIATANKLPAENRAEASRRTEATLKIAYGARYDANVAAINTMLDGIEHRNPHLVAALRPGRLLCSPNMFARLAGRAASLAAWAKSRP